jgi:glutamate-1-semialdehyde 2,1-aminomutase
MTQDIAERVENGEPPMVGTFNGNPLAASAAIATLSQVMTTEAYDHLTQLNALLKQECEAIIQQYRVPAHVVTIGAKGCLTFTKDVVTDVRHFKKTAVFELTELLWFYLANNGVWMTPGVDDEWTLSVQHTIEDVNKFVKAFKKMIQDITSK